VFNQLLSITIITILTCSLVIQAETSSVNALADPAEGIKTSSKFGTGNYYDEYQAKLQNIHSMITKPSVKEQIKNGIFAEDVDCNGDKVLVLKWDETSSACVNINTAKQLTEHGWGIVREQAVVPSHFGCGDYINISYNNTEHDHRKIVKVIRDTIRQYEKNDKRWEPITLNHKDMKDFVGISVTDKDLSDSIFEALKKAEHVSDVTGSVMCVD